MKVPLQFTVKIFLLQSYKNIGLQNYFPDTFLFNNSKNFHFMGTEKVPSTRMLTVPNR